MMLFVFFLMVVAIFLAAFGQRRWAIRMFILMLILAAFDLSHHVTSQLSLVL